MSKVLIVSVTRMKDERVCVGGVDIDEKRSVRLLDETGYHETKVENPYEIFDIWDIDYERNFDRRPPHSNEDVWVFDRHLIERQEKTPSVQKFAHTLVYSNIPVYTTSLCNTFEGCLKNIPPSKVLFVSSDNVPSHSTCFWVSDNPIIQRTDSYGKTRYYYRDPSSQREFSVPYVGTDENVLTVIPAGTLIRLSLAHWWSKDGVEEERCHLQLSGYFLQ